VSSNAVEERSTAGYCPVCNVSGSGKSAIFNACFNQANYVQCREDEYCGVELRQRKAQVSSLRVSCMKQDECRAQTRQNFASSSLVRTQCKPEHSLLMSPRFGQTSVCRGCVTACSTSTDTACIGRDSNGDYLLGAGFTFETALALDSDGRGIRGYWDNDVLIAA